MIRIVSLLVLAVSLSTGGGAGLALGAAVLGAGYGLAGAPGLPRLMHVLWHLRFLWLSLCVIYFWFTPGTPLVPAWQDWSPTYEGMSAGLVRVGVLALMVAAAHLLLASTPREQLLGAVHWLAAPLAVIGLSRERFALRLVLAMDTVPRVRALVRHPPPVRPSGRAARIAHTVAGLFHATLEQARRSEPAEIALPEATAPPWPEWLVPAALAAAFWLAAHL
ncbi:MAG: hypothetical protein GWO39_02210 [Gammaproteobacteria bacterium]|nr:hypothetical protein [Gammaproteobacteria bacterium]NIY31225.1 hypothetical protein [Gammaproteobacteria bacterium]